MALIKSRFKSRKIQRKEARKAKKQRRHEYYARRGKHNVQQSSKEKVTNDGSDKIKSSEDVKFKNLHEEQDYELKKEKRQKKKLDSQIRKKRLERLMKDNVEEEKEIKKLEKQLKFRKGKRSGAFALDGLDYLLDICDKKITSNEAERTFEESDTEFENDLATVTGNKKKNAGKVIKTQNYSVDESYKSSSESDFLTDSELNENEKASLHTNGSRKSTKTKGKKKNSSAVEESDLDVVRDQKTKNKKNKKKVKFVDIEDSYSDDNSGIDLDENFSDSEGFNENPESDVVNDIESDEGIKEPPHKKTKIINKEESKSVSGCNHEKKKKLKSKKKKVKQQKASENISDIVKEGEITENFSEEVSEVENDVKIKGLKDSKNSGMWEDIYGRMRDKDGNIIKTYKPPHLRKLESAEGSNKNQEKLLRLKRQLKGLLNRLAENNMASISSQIEELYMSHSRNDINQTLKELFTEAIVCEVLTPERLIAEHAMLIAILHANVGSEVGAYFLQFAVNEFHKMLKCDVEVEDKRLNNLFLFIMHLYNFQIFHSKLMYDLIHEILKKLEEKQIELLLLALRTVGFSLRKDDPVALKSVVLKVQEMSNTLGNNDENYTRMKYMVEVVSAVKNNNISKIPNYNPELVEHLKKCMKVLVRKGTYTTELNISLQDLLNAEEHGRWWVVGSAWSGSGPESNVKTKETKELNSNKMSFSQKLLDLAKKQRMNTDVRRTIFCTLMSAEDYLDAFEKLMKLGLKGAVEREIINVLIHCSLQEKEFNPYYFHLANKLSIFDRKYQMMIQYAVWDKLKELNNMLPIQVTNLAKFLGNIILNRGLPLSVLKVVQFSELDKISVKFIRQVLLTILLTDEETVAHVFSRIVNSPKLKIFRDGIRLFIHHFLLKNIKSDLGEDSNRLLKMIDVADKVLTTFDLRMIF